MEEIEKCVRCFTDFVQNDKTIACNFCETKYHLNCVKLDGTVSDVVDSCENLFWFCDDCVSVVQEKLQISKKLIADDCDETSEVVTDKGGNSKPLLIDFLQKLLNDESYARCISWRDPQERIFRIEDPPKLAQLWGAVKGTKRMDYNKLSRSLRHYYKLDLLKKPKFTGLAHCYQFTSKVPLKKHSLNSRKNKRRITA